MISYCKKMTNIYKVFVAMAVKSCKCDRGWIPGFYVPFFENVNVAMFLVDGEDKSLVRVCGCRIVSARVLDLRDLFDVCYHPGVGGVFSVFCVDAFGEAGCWVPPFDSLGVDRTADVSLSCIRIARIAFF